MIEDIEKNDWEITPDMSNKERYTKSVKAYWLNKWYEKVKNITFETYFYNNKDEIPNILPFEKCMARYENKSPKDSENWGPVSTKEELLNMFYTSLRCKTNAGEIYCVRKWVDLGDEYRCFWNNGLVAISSETKNEPPINEILEYINKISSKIFYSRCVFDIAHLKETNELVFVEFNSWESNSGAHRFNWLEDTQIFYEDINSNIVTIRWLNNGEKKIINSLINKVDKLHPNDTKEQFNFTDYVITKPMKPSNWLVTDKYIYVANDIWLGRFTLEMKPLNWTRGVFRFGNLQLCNDGCVCYVNYDGKNNFYYNDLTPKKNSSKISNIYNVECNNISDNISNNVKIGRYGLLAQHKNNGNYAFANLDSNCIFY